MLGRWDSSKGQIGRVTSEQRFEERSYTRSRLVNLSRQDRGTLISAVALQLGAYGTCGSRLCTSPTHLLDALQTCLERIIVTTCRRAGSFSIRGDWPRCVSLCDRPVKREDTVKGPRGGGSYLARHGKAGHSVDPR